MAQQGLSHCLGRQQMGPARPHHWASRASFGTCSPPYIPCLRGEEANGAMLRFSSEQAGPLPGMTGLGSTGAKLWHWDPGQSRIRVTTAVE